MPDELKVAYLKVIINMTYIDDNEVDDKELAEIFLLMSRLELNKDTRFKVRAYITEISIDNIEPIENLLETIKSNSESSLYNSLMISLTKDLINVYFSTNKAEDTKVIIEKIQKVKVKKENKKEFLDIEKAEEVMNDIEFTFLEENKKLFNIPNEEIFLAYSTIANDYALIYQDLDDTAIEKNVKELAAKAAAAGTPLAAVYISGSVLGLSAAGMTSGLATLGMGGILGLSSMATGIGAAAILGVVAYKGVKHLTGANELDKYKTRELMLHDVIKQTQKTISLIIDDVNYIVQKLNDTILNHSDQTEKIKKLTHMVAQFQGALKSVDKKSNTYQNSAYRLKNPKTLDIERLKSLTEESTKKPLQDFIMSNYELKKLTVDNNEVEKYTLKDDLNTEVLEKIAQIFKAIGYFDMDNILKGKASEGLSKVKGIFG